MNMPSPDSPIVTGVILAILGQHPEPQEAVQNFINIYGEEAFRELRTGVIREASKKQSQQSGIGGLIKGPGTGTSDSIPAQITQNGQPVEDIKVSDGEYILPKATVDAVGEPALDELRRQTAGT